MYAPSMLYSLPALAVDEEALADVQTNMMATALRKLGASKATPTAIRHGPYELGGLNIIDLRTELGISNLKFFRQAIFSESDAGKLLLISLKYTQIEAGITANILERPEIPLPYITATWITSLRSIYVPAQHLSNRNRLTPDCVQWPPRQMHHGQPYTLKIFPNTATRHQPG
jgi:hypothetical protein